MQIICTYIHNIWRAYAFFKAIQAAIFHFVLSFQKYMVYLLHLQKYKALNLIYAYENFSAYYSIIAMKNKI